MLALPVYLPGKCEMKGPVLRLLQVKRLSTHMQPYTLPAFAVPHPPLPVINDI